jgi:ketosteroid isomerase-like protein
METPNPDAARKLEAAKQDLQAAIESLVEEHLSAKGARASLDLSFDEGIDTIVEDTEHNAAVVEGTKALVDSFHDQPEVRQSGVRVRHVTAIDADGDGDAAINVRFEYPR